MKKGAVNIWMIAFFVLLGVFLFIAGTFLPNPLLNKLIVTPTVLPEQNVEIPTSLPTEAEVMVITPTVTIVEKSAEDQLRQAFANKYSKPISQVELSINKNTGVHASGGVKFIGEISGAWFLAYKADDGWTIVQDGNGTVSCEKIAPYNFPVSMVPECVDNEGNLITR